MLLGAGRGAGLDLGVEVLAVPGDLQEPGLVVDARDLPLHQVVIGHVQPLEQVLRADLHAVAQAHGLDAAAAQHGGGEHGHGVGVVEEPGVRADLLHVMGKVQHDRDGPQRAEDAADAQGVGDGLAQAVLLGHFEVRDGAGVVEPDLDGVDHVVGAAQGVLPVLHAEVGLDPGLVAAVAVEVFQHEAGVLQALGVDVVQGDGALGQGRGHHGVSQDVLGEHGAARPHKGDLRHSAFLL